MPHHLKADVLALTAQLLGGALIALAAYLAYLTGFEFDMKAVLSSALLVILALLFAVLSIAILRANPVHRKPPLC
jgi:uncharacterized membrane protein YcfT